MKKLCAITIIMLLINLAAAQSTKQAKAKSDNKESGRNVQPAAAGSVTGSGTPGRLSKWVGTSGSSTFVLGDTGVFEDKFGKVGIGTTAPSSPLTVQGMIETTLGGYKFPDGTVQTTAGLASVFHNATLTGNGTAASPLGVAVPLNLTGSTQFNQILQVSNSGDSGIGLRAIGGPRGEGVRAEGGHAGGGDAGGDGVSAIGGSSQNRGGSGLFARGGISFGARGGNGVIGVGGSSSGTFSGGVGVSAGGGLNLNSGPGGNGVEADGGVNVNGGPGGNGVKATGGNGSGSGIAGDGVVATGGNYNGTDGLIQAGAGVRATGGDGRSGFAGHGVVATGGHPVGSGVEARGSDAQEGGIPGGDGIHTTGGTGNGVGRSGGPGITAIAGIGVNGADQGLAGFFIGKVLINGDLQVNGTKNFKIDHPLDPENKYLSHAAIESSEVLNVYSGNVTTNEKGEATVTLPDWFEAINRDLRYQLTVIGQFAQAIVAERVKQNRFRIKTSLPNTEVSWQVTGVRADAAMLKHPFKTEEAKPERERGTYLNPDAYGQPLERGIEGARHSETMRQMKERREQRAQQTQGNHP